MSKKLKKATKVVSKEAIEELGRLVRASKRQVVQQKTCDEDGGVPEDVQIKKDLERVKILDEEMAILRRERAERDAKRDQAEKLKVQREEDVQDSPVTPPPSGPPKKTGPLRRIGASEQMRRRN